MTEIQKKEKKQISLIDAIMLLDGVDGAVSLFLKAFSKYEWNNTVFAVFFTLFIILTVILILDCIWKMVTVFFKYYKENNRPFYGEDVNRFEEFSLNRYIAKNKMKKREKRVFMALLTRSVFFGFILFVISISNTKNLTVYAGNVQEVFNALGRLFTGDEEGIINETLPQDDERESNESPNEPEDGREEDAVLKPAGFSFILDEPDKKFELEKDIIEQVYFCAAGFFRSSAVENYLESLSAPRMKGVDCHAFKEDGRNYAVYMKLEDLFKNRAQECAQEKYMTDWLKKAPHSEEIDVYIAGRLDLVTLEGQGCYETWWKLANDYQYYALEYEKQTDNVSAVLYYYTMSIYSCMEALRYEMREETNAMVYHYMVKRYQDICRKDCIIPEEYKALAGEIHEILEKSDTKVHGASS